MKRRHVKVSFDTARTLLYRRLRNMRLLDGRKYPRDPNRLSIGKKSHVTKLMGAHVIQFIQGLIDNKFRWHLAAVKQIPNIKPLRKLLESFSMAESWLIADKLVVLTAIDDTVSYYRDLFEVHIMVPSAGVKYRVCFGLNWLNATFTLRAHARDYKGIDIRGNEYVATEEVGFCNPNTWQPMDQTSIEGFEESLTRYRAHGFSGGLTNAPIMFISTLDQRAPRRHRLNQQQNPNRSQAVRDYFAQTDTVRSH